MNIVLAGMPGSGKSTVAEVFRSRGKKVVDTDAEIVSKHGSISEIFENYGEQYFRQLETQTVKEVCTCDNIVIATGGGCLLRAENVQTFKKNGKIVYLRTGIDTLVKRVEGDNSRPLLKGGARERLEELFKARADVYQSSADIIIDTDELTPEEVADKITESI